jgi:type 1 fimbriae regulatory protein FimB/type 1 fimbriae regulatory protein FimE
MATPKIVDHSAKRQAGERSTAAKTLPKVTLFGKVSDAGMRKAATLRLVPDTAPTRFFGRVPPRKPKNDDRRPREHLTEVEVEALAKAAGNRGRYGHRDRTMVMVCFRHGLRVNELVSLRWDEVNLDEALLTVRRDKNGRDTEHPIPGEELRALRRLKREQRPGSPFVFMTERGGPMTDRAFRLLLSKAGEEATLPFPVHPHMLRHAAGYKLVNDRQPIRAIQQYLGHRRIASTERYTEIDQRQFKEFFR